MKVRLAVNVPLLPSNKAFQNNLSQNNKVTRRESNLKDCCFSSISHQFAVISSIQRAACSEVLHHIAACSEHHLRAVCSTNHHHLQLSIKKYIIFVSFKHGPSNSIRDWNKYVKKVQSYYFLCITSTKFVHRCVSLIKSNKFKQSLTKSNKF